MAKHNIAELQEAIVKHKDKPMFRFSGFTLLEHQAELLTTISNTTKLSKSKLMRMGLEGIIELYKQGKL